MLIRKRSRKFAGSCMACLSSDKHTKVFVVFLIGTEVRFCKKHLEELKVYR